MFLLATAIAREKRTLIVNSKFVEREGGDGNEVTTVDYRHNQQGANSLTRVKMFL